MPTATKLPDCMNPQPAGLSLGAALGTHWPEYLMEAANLGIFMISACVFGVLLGYPGAPLHEAIQSPMLRQLAGGIAMGLTAIGIISSPWGQRSGAHMNPSLTLSFFMLGKVQRWDALFYVVFQFLGGIGGVALAYLLLGPALRHMTVNYVVTVPGAPGPAVAFWAEVLISFLMLSTVLAVSNSKRLTRFTPYFAGALVATYITFESPISGMSMNPARTFGSAVWARQWNSLWIYFTAPPLGMFLAATLYRIRYGLHRVYCVKFHHHNGRSCIFRCNYGGLLSEGKETL